MNLFRTWLAVRDQQKTARKLARQLPTVDKPPRLKLRTQIKLARVQQRTDRLNAAQQTRQITPASIGYKNPFDTGCAAKTGTGNRCQNAALPGRLTCGLRAHMAQFR